MVWETHNRVTHAKEELKGIQRAPRALLAALPPLATLKAWVGRMRVLAENAGYSVLPVVDEAVTQGLKRRLNTWRSHGYLPAKLLRRSDKLYWRMIHERDYASEPPIPEAPPPQTGVVKSKAEIAWERSYGPRLPGAADWVIFRPRKEAHRRAEANGSRTFN